MKNKNITSFEDLMSAISSISPTGKAFEKLGYYMERNIHKIVFMNAVELADVVNVSQGSVSRFCANLGYTGFRDFQRALRDLLQSRGKTDHPENYLSKLDIDDIIDSEVSNLESLREVFTQPSYVEMVHKLSSVHRIFILSSRMSGAMLYPFAYNLIRIGKDVSVIDESDLLWEASDLFSKDRMVFFTAMFSLYPHSLIFKLERLKEAGLKVTGITDSSFSPLTNLADPVISLPVTEHSPFDFYGAPSMFLGVLAQDIAAESTETSEFMDNLRQVEESSYIYHHPKR